MDQKEKVTALISMGFTTDEAIALASGNYKTVPDPQPQPDPQPDPQPQPQPDPQPQPQPQPQPDPQPQPQPINTEQITQAINKGFEDINKMLVNMNILGSAQPAEQGVDDILGQLINPKLPE